MIYGWQPDAPEGSHRCGEVEERNMVMGVESATLGAAHNTGQETPPQRNTTRELPLQNL